MADVEILSTDSVSHLPQQYFELTLMPSWVRHGGTAELSSSASDNSIGNFSTADIGISPL